MKYLFLFFSLFVLTTACHNPVNNKAELNTPHEYEIQKTKPSIRLYCWCFLSGKVEKQSNGIVKTTGRDCTTTVPVTPGSLISQEYLLEEITDTILIRSIKHLIYDKKKSESVFERGLDARFVILIADESHTDTLVLNYGSLVQNGSKKFDYNFNIVDSLKSLLHKDVFDCSD